MKKIKMLNAIYKKNNYLDFKFKIEYNYFAGVMCLNIDLTKLFNRELDEIIIDESIKIPEDYYKDNDDIKDVSLVKVFGDITDNQEYFSVNLNIKCELTLVCSVSLKDVKYNIDINIEEIIGENDNNLEEFDKIINNSIDLLPIIWQNILVEVPMRVVSEDVQEENIYGNGWKFITKEEESKEIDPRLSKLKDFLSE